MIDAHCHMTYKGLNRIKDKVVEEARKEMKAIITCGLPEDAERTLDFAEKYPDFVYVSLGIHPTDVTKINEKQIEDYKSLIRKNKSRIIALGEIGLDYHWIRDSNEIKKSKEVFIDFLNLAKELKLPVFLHTRKAEEDVLKIVVDNDVKSAIFHCYTGNVTLARKIAEEGYFISITTNLPNSKNAKKVVKSLPLECLLTETDAPFLSPYPSKPNLPQNVKLILEEMSKIRQQNIEEIDEAIDKNCERLFSIS